MTLILVPTALAANYNGHWAAPYIDEAHTRGWMMGYEDGTFRPDASITRGEMTKLLITAYDGENAPDEPADGTAPVITLTQNPTTDTYGSVKISVTIESENDITYIGRRSSSSGAGYTDKTGFTDITSAKEFSVSTNGWYAVCAVDSAGNFAYKLTQVTNMRTSSGGGSGSSTTYYTVTYDANGGMGNPYLMTNVSGSHTVLDIATAGFTAPS